MSPADRFAFVTKMREQGQKQFERREDGRRTSCSPRSTTPRRPKPPTSSRGSPFGPGPMRGADAGRQHTTLTAMSVGCALHAAALRALWAHQRPEGNRCTSPESIHSAEGRPMSNKTSLTRRQALLLSGSAAAGLAVGGLPRWAHGAPSSAPALPIPQTDRGAQRRTRHALAAEEAVIDLGRAPAVPSTGNFIELPRAGRARPQRRYHPVPGGKPPRRGDDAALARAAGALARRWRSAQYDQAGRVSGPRRSRSSSRRRRPGSIPTRTGTRPGKFISGLPA